MKRDKNLIIKNRYLKILKFVKEKCKVYHRDLSKDNVGGYYNPDNHIISINRQDKYTLEGCFFLLHEYFHYIDHKKGKFKKFYDWYDNEDYSDKKMKLIISAEQSASRQAVNLLKKFHVFYTSDDLKPDGLKKCIKFWRKFYFKD